tara:strand:+ start:2584 stop:3009 length:426 start_codon:yes stop_codon:yes gene_type:complete
MQSKRIHSTSVVLEDNGVLIIGDSGSGKSDLALRLIDSGATLISDDVTICKKRSNQITLSCPKETKGLLEVREVGIITVPYVEEVKLIMVVKLTNIGLKRLPDKSFSKILDIKVPLLSLDGKNPSDVVKVKVKLNEIKEET